jgi:protein-tyrosine phosphatase
MAEGVLRAKVAHRVGDGTIEIDSAGTHDYQEGKPPFRMAVEAAAKRGYRIEHLVARRIAAEDLDRFEMILCMDRGNFTHLKKLAPTRCQQRIELLLEYGNKFHGKDVPDPYGGDTKAFEKALDMIEDGVEGLVEVITRMQAAGYR